MMAMHMQPLLDMVCAEIVNMVLGSLKVHNGKRLHFYFLYAQNWKLRRKNNVRIFAEKLKNYDLLYGIIIISIAESHFYDR